MNKLDEFKYNVAGKNITVIGIGISNLPLIKYLVSLGANVTACDRRSAEDLGENYTELEKLGVKFNLGDGYLNNLSGDMIFKTPGMRYDVPELLKAKENGSIVTSEMEVFFEVCPSHIIAVTGSDGKTTTTTLIHKMMTVLFTSVNFHGIKSSTLQKLLKRVMFLMFTLRTLTEKQRRFLLDLRRLRTILGQSLNQRLM